MPTWNDVFATNWNEEAEVADPWVQEDQWSGGSGAPNVSHVSFESSSGSPDSGETPRRKRWHRNRDQDPAEAAPGDSPEHFRLNSDGESSHYSSHSPRSSWSWEQPSELHSSSDENWKHYQNVPNENWDFAEAGQWRDYNLDSGTNWYRSSEKVSGSSYEFGTK